MTMSPQAPLLPRLQRGWAYLREGSLADRLLRLWRDRRRGRRRARWVDLMAQGGWIEFPLQPDVRLRLYGDDEMSRLIYCEDFEWQERQFLNRFLRPGDLFVDVGANIGLFSLIAAQRVGVTGHVYAFEPGAQAYQRLLENVELNRRSNVSCFQLALSDKSGEATLTVSVDGHDAWNSLASPIAGTSFATQAVPAVSWDEFARAHELFGRITMIKIDIEGWECRMLQGADESLVRPDAPLLQVEFTDQAAAAAGSSCAQLYGMLREYGYQMFVYDGLRKRLVPDPLRESYPYVNLIAVKALAPVLARLGERSSVPMRRSIG